MTKERSADDMNTENKRLLVSLLIVCYGTISVPAYWLKDASMVAFNSLMALYVVYAVVTYLLVVVLNMYIPHCMRIAGQKDSIDLSILQQTHSSENKTPNNDTKTPNSDNNTLVDGLSAFEPMMPRKYGFKMSILGGFGTSAGGILALVLVIILFQALLSTDGQTAGLLVTTVFGCITIVGSIVAYLGLPTVPAKPSKHWRAWWLELFTPFQDFFQRKNMMVLLLSYTIYTDTVFALSSVTGQLYFIEVRPDTLEYSLYSMAGTIFQVICALSFYLWQIWRPPFTLEYWLVLGCALILIVPLWGCIGLADNINFGFKVAIPSITYEIHVSELTLHLFTEPLEILRPNSYLQSFGLDC